MIPVIQFVCVSGLSNYNEKTKSDVVLVVPKATWGRSGVKEEKVKRDGSQPGPRRSL